MEIKYYQVDAFTKVPNGGNPAGVVLDAQGLEEEEMQAIAQKVNLSETAFIFSPKGPDHDYHIRFFTPTQEVDLCGHATIAAFRLLGDRIPIGPEKGYVVKKQKTKAGILSVEIAFQKNKIESIMMTQSAPEFFGLELNTKELARIVGLDEEKIGLAGMEINPEIVSTGLPDIILPVKNIEALKEIKPNYEALTRFCENLGVVGIHAFSTEKDGKDFEIACRNFAPAVGILEEAATGTSNGALGAYLVKHGLLSLHKTICIQQGIYMGRPSEIFVRVEGSIEAPQVKVGGNAVKVLEGIIRL